MVSLGSGSGATKMSGDVPVLCLDKDRKAVFSGIVNLKGNCLKKKNVLFHSYFDIRQGKELLKLLEKLHISLPYHSIRLLFQHPDPGLKRKCTYKEIGFGCMKALKLGYCDEIHFVYDVFHERNCWKKYEIIDHFIDKHFKRDLIIEQERVISQLDEENVKHPLFGKVKRMGWAKMKRGQEHTFLIKY